MYYTHTDHLGSLTEITDNTGTLIQRIVYNAWGERELFVDNTNTGKFLFDRGFTGHEHLDEFGLINMNGRMYDPALGVMLSPDNYVQNPYGTQGFNRYSYAGNNPLVFVDPSGDFIFTTWSFTIDFWKTIFSGGIDPWNTPENRREAWENFDPSAEWSKTNKAWRIEKGLFATDPNKTNAGRAWELFSRFTWQLPQTLVGYVSTGMHNLLGGVKSVNYYGGSTVVESYSGNWGAVTLSNYIIGQRDIAADPNNWLFQHEYGHYIQSQISGPAYFVRYGIPSLFSARPHDYSPVEQDANVRAIKYFKKNNVPDFEWKFKMNPIGRPGTNWTMDDYYTPQFQSLLKSLTIKPNLFDYIFPIPSSIYNTTYYNSNPYVPGGENYYYGHR